MRLAFLVTVLLLLGALAAAEPAPIPMAVASTDKQVVIALADSGINPYHVNFRDTSPLAYQHPSTYIAGYPASAVAVPLTLDAPDLKTAIAADAAVWATLVPETLYWFPGTKIVGAIAAEVAVENRSMVTFSMGHGTMTASRAAGNEYSLCPECRIVMMQAGTILRTDGARYIRWAADQPWIDVQSHSWSGLVPFNNPVELGDVRGAMVSASARMPVFTSAGNGVAGKGGVLGHPAFTRPMSGAPGAIPVGGHDNGFVTAWTAQYPYVSADACSSWAAVGTTIAGFSPTEGGGTSASTPYSAGEAARVLLEARRILDASGNRAGGVLAQGTPTGSGPLADGALSLDELKAIVFRTAERRATATVDDGVVCDVGDTPANTLPVAWADVPEDVDQYPLIGWGIVNERSLALALDVVSGDAPLPVRPADEAAHAQAEAIRSAYHTRNLL